MSQGDQDKTEQPTPYRLEEARKRGEIAKSPEVAGMLVMVAFAAIVALTGTTVAKQIASATKQMLLVAGTVPDLDRAFVGVASRAYAPLWQSMMPLVLGLIVAGIVGNMVQTGPMFTAHPLKPDFKRLHPMQAIRRVFSFRSIWELGKLVAKAVLLVAICALFVKKAPALVQAVTMTVPTRIGDVLLAAFVKTSLYVLLVLGIVALADLLFTRREYLKKMRMSRRELKDEFKRRDGDPTVKTKQKQLLRELLKKTRAIGQVPGADVVLTNPTHYAIALRYRPNETFAPVVVAKGSGLLAARIRTLAHRHKVPVLRNPELARALYKECGIDEMVPHARYQALVPIYRELWASTGMPRGGRR